MLRVLGRATKKGTVVAVVPMRGRNGAHRALQETGSRGSRARSMMFDRPAGRLCCSGRQERSIVLRYVKCGLHGGGTVFCTFVSGLRRSGGVIAKRD